MADASVGVGEMTHRIADTAQGANNITRNVSEATQATRLVAENMSQVNRSSEEIQELSGTVTDKSKEMAAIAIELRACEKIKSYCERPQFMPRRVAKRASWGRVERLRSPRKRISRLAGQVWERSRYEFDFFTSSEPGAFAV